MTAPGTVTATPGTADQKPDVRPVSPSALRARLDQYATIIAEIQDGLIGKPFRWGDAQRHHFSAKAAAMGVTLVTRSGAVSRGFTLKARVKPVGAAYYGAPISKWRDLYVLECQCVRSDQGVKLADTGTAAEKDDAG